jgi:hypothetical protein
MQKLTCMTFGLFGTALVLALTTQIVTGAGAAPVAVSTYHYDNLRSGWNDHETTLSATSFPADFGILQTVALDDEVDTQPLLVPGLTIAGGTHDVVYVATASNSVYAIDASSGAILVQRNLGPPVAEPIACDANGPNVGINGTPVIDPVSQTLYLIAYVDVSGTPTYYVHALALSTLADKITPVVVSASHKLTDGSVYTFNATYERQRPGLLYNNNTLYAAFGSFCDFSHDQSRGWILGWSGGSLTPLATNQLDDSLPVKPGGVGFYLSSIWMSGYGIAASGPNLYAVTGNSDSTSYNGVSAVQESLIALGPNFNLHGVFTPSNHSTLDTIDGDLGSGGVLVLPEQPGAFNLAVLAGKDGRLFLINLAPGKDAPPTAAQTINDVGPCWCGPSYFVGSDNIPRIVTSQLSSLRTWKLTLTPAPGLVSQGTSSIVTGQDWGFFTWVTSNGTKAGSAIIWAVSRPTNNNPATVNLYAFAADPVSGAFRQLFMGAAGTWPYTNGNSNIVPVVANGKAYVASYQRLTIFGAGATAAAVTMTTSMITPAASAPVAPRSGHLVSGTIAAVDPSMLTLQTRTGESVKIDYAQAAKNERIGPPLDLGTPLTVQGSIIETNGALQATSIVRAKGQTGELWPADR